MRFPMNVTSRSALTALFTAGLLLSGGAVRTLAQTSAAAPAPATPAATQPLSTAPGNVVPNPIAPAPSVLPPVTAPIATPTTPIAIPTATTDVMHLVLKRSKRRVYVYQNDKEISSYPVAVGKAGWETPLGEFKVLNMEPNPIFKSFKSGRVIPPGPDNPLGVRWIGIWTDGKTQLGFHGTNEPELIGQAVSHGCIRMMNKDVVKLYAQVKTGTPVQIVP
jgi:L,D-transpeptidase ErfK/SrfK